MRSWAVLGLVLAVAAVVEGFSSMGARRVATMPRVVVTARAAPRMAASLPSDAVGLRAFIKDKREAIATMEKDLRQERRHLTTAEERLATALGRNVVVNESSMRSLAKAIGWRITAGLVTMATSLFFTGGNWRIALTIVGSDFVSKSATMYVGERLFNKVQIGRGAGGDNPMRSVAKALIWRLFAAVNTLVVSAILVKEVSVGAKIAGVDSIVKTTLMVLYDQAWNKVDWGKKLENVGGDGI